MYCSVFVSQSTTYHNEHHFIYAPTHLCRYPSCGWIVRTIVSWAHQVQVLLLAYSWIYLFREFRRCFFSVRRCFRRLQGASGDFVNLKIICRSAKSLGCAHRGRVWVCVFIGGSVPVYIWAPVFVCVIQKKKTHLCRALGYSLLYLHQKLTMNLVSKIQVISIN